jgi:hypothetical protein
MQFGTAGPLRQPGRPVFLVGGGASLRGFDFGRLAPIGEAIGINKSMFDVECSCGISIDHPFVRNSGAELKAFASVCELYLAVGDRWFDVLEEVPGAIYLRQGEEPLSLDPGALATGGTSGYAALNLAALKGARHIVLLGFDYGLIGGRHHYHDAYPWHHVANDQSWSRWARRFDAMAPRLRARGIHVLNASPASAIECFPKCEIETALQWAARVAS